MLINIVGICYLIYAGSVVIHEVFHLIAALVFGIKVEKIRIGNLINIKIMRLSFSPIIFSGYVDVDALSLVSKSRISVVCFFLSGVLGNLLMIPLALFCDSFVLRVWIVWVNIIAVANSLLPKEGNDFTMLCDVIRKHRTGGGLREPY